MTCEPWSPSCARSAEIPERDILPVPSVRRIVYSTCSVHAIENEHVVRQALKTEEATTGGFKLAPKEKVLPTWPRRGFPEEMDDPGKRTLFSTCTFLDVDVTCAIAKWMRMLLCVAHQARMRPTASSSVSLSEAPTRRTTGRNSKLGRGRSL